MNASDGTNPISAFLVCSLNIHLMCVLSCLISNLIIISVQRKNFQTLEPHTVEIKIRNQKVITLESILQILLFCFFELFQSCVRQIGQT